MKKPTEKLISRRQLAVQVGVQHSAVNKACKCGKVDLVGDKVSLLGANTRAYIAAQKQRISGELSVPTSCEPAGPKGVLNRAQADQLPRAELERIKIIRQISRLEQLARRSEIDIDRANHEFAQSKCEVLTKDALAEYLTRLWDVVEALHKGTVDRIYLDLLQIVQTSDPAFYSKLWPIFNKDVGFIFQEIDRLMSDWDSPIEIKLPDAPKEAKDGNQV